MFRKFLIAAAAAVLLAAPATAADNVLLNQANGNFWILKTTDDGSGNQQVNVICTSGCAGGGSVTITGALPAGTNTIGNVGVGQGSTTSGQSGPLVQGAVTTANPAYTSGQTSPLSLTPTGQLRAALYSSAGTAFGVTSAGGGLLTGGIYNSAAPVITSGNNTVVQVNSSGSQFIDTSGREASYACSANVTLAATPTDVVTIYGSATTNVRIRHVEVSGIATVAGGMQGTLTVRSTANTAGTSTATTAVPMDSTSAAATGTCRSYTANPTGLGTAVGAIRTVNIPMPLIAGGVPPIVFDFSTRNSQPIILRGTAQGLVLNLGGGAVPTGGTVQVAIEWTEN